MTTEVEPGLETLSISECDELLRVGGVGILALSGGVAPVLRPVNFAVHGDYVLIRTGEGQILEAAQCAEPSSFVISEIDRFEHTGWSVVVTGTLSEHAEVGPAQDIPLRPWARDPKHHFVGLSIDELSGRRINASGSGR